MNDITPTEAMATIRRVADIFAPPECPRCLDFGELVAVGHGRTIRLDQWNGDSGDVVDCECKGEPMSTDRTARREDLIAKIVVESLTQSPCDEDSNLPSWSYLAARTIMAEFPEIGQRPHIDPALRERIELAITTYGYIRRNKNDMTKWDEALEKAMALIDTIAPAAQPLPTRGQIYTAWNEKPEAVGDDEHAYVCDLIAAGYAREDEPEPQVDCDKCKGEPMTTNSGYVSIATETVGRLIGIVRDYAEHTEDEHGYSFPVGIAKQIAEELQVALNGGNWWNGDRP